VFDIIRNGNGHRGCGYGYQQPINATRISHGPENQTGAQPDDPWTTLDLNVLNSRYNPPFLGLARIVYSYSHYKFQTANLEKFQSNAVNAEKMDSRELYPCYGSHLMSSQSSLR
jgi:hypothetical protein